MSKPRVLFMLLLMLGLCLILPFSAQAVEFGERAYGDYEDMTLNASSSVAEVLDWLEDFLNEEVGYVMQSTTDLMEMVDLVQTNAMTAAQLPTTSEHYKNAMDVYADACDQNAEISFYYDRLTNLYVQRNNLRQQIKSGEFLPETIDQMKRELDQAESEAKRLAADAVAKYRGWKTGVLGLQSGLEKAAETSTPLSYLAAVRSLAQPLLHQQAALLAAQENTGSDAPIVTVISDKEIAFTALYKKGSRNIGIPGVTVEVWQVGKPDTKKTVKTDKEGTVVLWAADFKPDAKGFMELEVSYDGSTATDGKKYQKRELGRIYIRNGRFLNMFLKEDDGKPYIIRATLDDLDMLSIDNGAALSRFNDADHTLKLKVDATNDSVEVDMWYYTYYETDWEFLFKEKFKKGDTTTHTFTRKWLKFGEKNALPNDKHAYFSLYYGYGNGGDPTANANAPYTGDDIRDWSSYSSKRSAAEQPNTGEDKDAGKGMIGKVGFALPDDIPFIGGAKLEFPRQSNMTINIVPGRSYYLAFNHKFTPDKTNWKNQNVKDQAANDEAIKEVGAGKIASTKQGMKEENMAAQRKTFLAKADISFTPYFFVCLETPTWDSDKSAGSAGLGLIISFKMELTKQFHLGPVPAFISLEVGFSINVGGTLGAEGKVMPDGSIKNMKVGSSAGLSFNLNVHLSASVTLGAGLPRFAYLGMRMAGFMDFTFSLGKLSKRPTLELYIHADVVVKFLCFSKEWTFWDKAKSIPLGSALAEELLEDSFESIPQGEYPKVITSGEDVKLGITTVEDTHVYGPTTVKSGDLKYYKVGDKVFTFYIGTGARGETSFCCDVHIQGQQSVGYDIPVIDHCDSGYKYPVEFDIDYHNGTFYFIATVSKEKETTLPQTEKELAAQRAARANAIGLVFCTFTPDAPSKIKDVHFQGKNNINYTPRIKALYQPVSDRTFVVGGVRVADDTETLMLSYNTYAANDKYFSASDNQPDYRIRDIHLLDYLGNSNDTIGVSCFTVVQSNKIMYNFFSPSRSIRKILFKDADLKCFSLSEQVYWDRSKDNSTGFLVCLGKENKSMPETQYTQSTAFMYLDRTHGMTPDTFMNGIVLKDMGISNSSDGVLPVTVKLGTEYQVYAYWGQSYSGGTKKDLSNSKTYIKAMLIDPKSKLCSEPFDWFSTTKQLHKLRILPVTDGTQKASALYTVALMDGAHVLGYELRMLRFSLSPDLTLRGFGTEYPVVTQGKDFGMYFRMENTGPIVIKSFDIDVRGVRQSGDGEKEVSLKRFHIDAGNPEKNSVTHYERDPNANNFVTTGEHTIYRIEDIRDPYNGEIVQTTTMTGDGSKPTTKTEYLKALMPGAVRTYKTTVTNSPTKWHGKYALFAKVVEIHFNMQVGEYADGAEATEYVAKWNDATDTFDISIFSGGNAGIGGNGETLTLFSYDAPEIGYVGNAGAAQSNLVTNETFNATLTRADELYADVNNNDLVIKVDTTTIEGEEYAVINLKNDSLPTAPEVTPKLTAKIVNGDGNEIETYSLKLKTPLAGGFGRTLMIPVSKLSGGKPYLGLKLYVGSANGGAYYEVNEASNVARIDSMSVFAVDGVEDVKVAEGGKDGAVFVAAVSGPKGMNYTYQWKVIYPDGSSVNLAQETGATLVIPTPNLSQNGFKYLCAVSNGKTIETSRAALLTVIKKAPVTGDNAQPWIWLALLIGSAAIMLLATLVYRRAHKVR